MAAEEIEGALAAAEFGLAGGPFEGEAVSTHFHQWQAVLQQDGHGGEGPGDDQVVGLAMVGGRPFGGDCRLKPAVPGFTTKRLGPLRNHRCIAKLERGDQLPQQRGAAEVGFDQEVGCLRASDGEDEAGEAGAGADVGDALAGADVADEKGSEGIEEVLDRCSEGIGDGGDAVGAVAEEEGVVPGEEVELGGCEGEAEVGCIFGKRLVEELVSK